MFHFAAKVLWFLATPSNLLPELGGRPLARACARLVELESADCAPMPVDSSRASS